MKLSCDWKLNMTPYMVISMLAVSQHLVASHVTALDPNPKSFKFTLPNLFS